MIKQYLQIKEKYQDSILFFRLGDFYEMFFEDAQLASRALEITLTARDGGQGQKIPMCGVPYHAAETYIARLIERNYKIAVCEQVEEPGESRGIVRREVTRVITPGTVLEGNILDDKSHNYLACVVEWNRCFGLAHADITTGHFMATQFTGIRGRELLCDELIRLQPAEVLAANDEIVKDIGDAKFMLSNLDVHQTEFARAKKLLEQQYGFNLQGTGLDNYPAAVCAAGGLLAYLYETQHQKLAQLGRVEVYSTGEFMVLDSATRRNLELTVSLADGGRRGTLLSSLDYTCTAMGGRMLRNWLEQPLMDMQKITRRHSAVERLTEDVFLRDSVYNLLDPIFDLERLGSKVAGGTANARDLLSLKHSLKILPELKNVLVSSGTELLECMAQSIDSLDEIHELLEKSINDEPPLSVREAGIIKSSFSDQVDHLRRASSDGKTWLTELETKERKRTGIKSLKVKFNKVFGYYIEVTRANLDLVPDDYTRKQTLVNAERFVTSELKEYEELILGAEDRLVQLEYRLFCEVREQVASYINKLRCTAESVAKVDALLSLAEASIRNNYIRPTLTEFKQLFITEGRHAVVESMLDAGEFVPNDTNIYEDNFVSIITGPNMAGKSTYMRQVALIVLLAQIGSFIPAKAASIGITDRIFTRVGAADDLAGGRSTFMVEMSECRNIMEYGTEHSLIIMDEVGRGTSTYDGISLARAMVEFIHEHIKARTLFSTHYHELTDLDSLACVENYSVTVKEQGEEIVFLRKLEPGKADRSYGIQVAKLAGLPDEILQRAREVLTALEENQKNKQEIAVASEEQEDKVSREKEFNRYLHVLQKLKTVNVMQMTPLEALNTIAKWQEILIELEK